MSHVFVLNTHKQPLDPIHPGQARWLLSTGKAAVYRRCPFTIILQAVGEEPVPAPLRLKIDPGATTTGLVLLNDATGQVMWAAHLMHRGTQIKKALETRRVVRRARRSRTTRYRPARWANRRRTAGWLPPSLRSRVENILTWVMRIRRLAPVAALSQEVVRFDLQQMQHPEISGVEYQHGELFGYEVREYLLEKFERICVYCGATGVPLEVEHVIARSKGGSNRISNLVLACVPCNREKGNQDLTVFLKHKPDVLKRVHAQLQRPLKDAAAVNTTRKTVYERLQETGLPVETGSGGLTKYHRTQRRLPKLHWCDAACVGASTPDILRTEQVVPWLIEARGRGHRRMMLVNAYGFPRGWRKRQKRYFSYQTGDLVRAVVPRGARKGTHVGRVVVKASGAFTIQTPTGKVPDVAHRYCQILHRTDGYGYHIGSRLSSLPTHPKGAPVSSPA